VRNFNRKLLAGTLGFTLMSAGNVLAFSFSIDDDDDYYRPYWGAPYAAPGWGAPPQAWGPPVQFQPWVTPPQRFWYPQLRSYDRSKMKQGRQRHMGDFDDAMNEIRAMLYGNEDFDRTQAIQIARKIEATSGEAMTGNFHPGSVVTMGSRTSPRLWGNEEAFKSNAEAMKAAAGALAEELGKKPTDEEGAIYLSQRSVKFGQPDERKEVPVSPQIWKKFNELSDTCVACHSNFRGPSW